MLSLPNNCRVGKFSIFPKNWKTKAANHKVKWRIVYWFYDDELSQKKQVVLKGMNHYSTLEEKQDFVRVTLAGELDDLKSGYNPITNKYAEQNNSEIDENSGLLTALDYALKNVSLEHNTRIDVTNCLKYMIVSTKYLNYDLKPLSTIHPKHIKAILDGCSRIKTFTDKKGNIKPKKWGAYQFNRNRTYLSLLFGYLVENFIIPVNPVHPIKKQPQMKRIRETTTIEQRTQIKEFSMENLYTFYRFIQIFFHSGSRIVELLRIKKEDIRLSDQKFKILVKKGKQFEEQYRTIKTIALPFWNEIYKEALPGQYIFSEDLKPGFKDKPIRGEQITRRWRRHIKHKLGITADIYSLKHSNLDEIAASFGIGKAQEAAGHSTPVITMTYLHGEGERQHNRLKDAINEF